MAATVIVDYGVGNVGAVANMVRRAGGEVVVSRDPSDVHSAERLILPGVGAFDRAMDHLVDSGMVDVLQECVVDRGTPLLGICVGMQVLGSGSEEGGQPGLGWIDARVQRFRQPPNEVIRIPQMGWNRLRATRADPLLAGFERDSFYLYFLHSYHMVCANEADVLAWTSYGGEFPAMVRSGNVWGVQGHPEKSHRYGMALFKNFLKEGRGAS